jgi:heterotetrameric sarcosine oxidase gamma subunit
MQEPPALTPVAPFAQLPIESHTSCAVTACDRDGLGIATVLARRGMCDALAWRARELLRIELPAGPQRTSSDMIAIVGTGPGAWLAIQEQGGNAFAAMLGTTLGDLAAVSDQTDGYAVLRLCGPKVRDTLCKLIAIDLHPRSFRVGHAAVTVAGHIGITMWRVEDASDGSPVFDIAVFRSLAASLWSALNESAAEFGMQIRAPL